MEGESTNQREYLSVAQLAALTPWSEAAIRTLMARGKLRQDEHYFKPFGPSSHPIFKWTAVKQLIEGTKSCATPNGTVSLANGAVIELGEDDA